MTMLARRAYDQLEQYASLLRAYEKGFDLTQGRPFIEIRLNGILYLRRYWLSEPVIVDGEMKSYDSILLHEFIHPDTDRALHDHPNEFTSVILQGGYDEALMPTNWASDFGPEPIYITRRHAGDVIERSATDFHSITALEQGTVTLVATGPKVKEWFFWPADERPIHNKLYAHAGG